MHQNHRNHGDHTKESTPGRRNPELCLSRGMVSCKWKMREARASQSVLWSAESAVEKVACPHSNN